MFDHNNITILYYRPRIDEKDQVLVYGATSLTANIIATLSHGSEDEQSSPPVEKPAPWARLISGVASSSVMYLRTPLFSAMSRSHQDTGRVL
ncbi:hypothetical protein E2562_028229 [Oryza meyeriana var. granulata]|uniref:Uncharacterized protein n=1 Tax=Oryza meyeriana var. granulata TaxID=110450 RepID=A0A6G1DPB5_9ORYZ|nr:hypothetical protein E2562_028229 [Oryza meyeriana var. granulata]